MGLLDELEQEAQWRKASGGDAARLKAEREQVYRTQIEPGMAALYEYLQKLTANLKILQPRKQLRYQLAGYGDVVGYIEHDYELQISTQAASREIKLVVRCGVASEECPTIEVQGAGKVKAVAGAFQRYHLGGMLEPRKDGSGEVVSARFNAKGRLVLSALFNGDAESGSMRLTFTNFEGLGSVTKTVGGAQLDEALFDDIGRFLTREPNSLLHETLPDAYRMQLRTKVQQEQIKRRWETRIGEQQQSELADIKRQRSITGRMARLVVKDDKPAAPGGDTPEPESKALAAESWLGRLKGLIARKPG